MGTGTSSGPKISGTLLPWTLDILGQCVLHVAFCSILMDSGHLVGLGSNLSRVTTFISSFRKVPLEYKVPA